MLRTHGSVQPLQRSVQRLPGTLDLVDGLLLKEPRILSGSKPIDGAQSFVARHLTGLPPTIVVIGKKDMAESESGGILDDEAILPFDEPPRGRQSEGTVLAHLKPDPCVARLSMGYARQPESMC